jgi:polyisoprenoid-binding protein YceI
MTLKRIAIGGLIAAAGAIGLTVAAFMLLLGDAPEAVSLEAAVQAASSETAETTSTAATAEDPESSPSSERDSESSSAASSGSDAGDLAGSWALVADGTSFVGYRVQEELASIGATTAVGRTTEVSGTLEFDGTTITAVSIEADVSALESDEDFRDQALRRQALETASYPTATFVLSEPIVLDVIPAEGEAIAATAAGELTLHAVTQPIVIDLEGTLVDGRVVIVGSTTIVFADYGVDQPQAMSVLSVAEEGTLELQLIFEQV